MHPNGQFPGHMPSCLHVLLHVTGPLCSQGGWGNRHFGYVPHTVARKRVLIKGGWGPYLGPRRPQRAKGHFKDNEVSANGIVLLIVLCLWDGAVFIQFLWPKRLLSLGAILGVVNNQDIRTSECTHHKSIPHRVHSPQVIFLVGVFLLQLGDDGCQLLLVRRAMGHVFTEERDKGVVRERKMDCGQRTMNISVEHRCLFQPKSLCLMHTGKPMGVAVSHCITWFQTQQILTTPPLV